MVALELRAGAPPTAVAKLVRDVFQPFETRGRFFAPSYATWKRAGAAIADLQREGLRLSETTRAFYNDVLLAASCREHGITLITRDVSDFARIQRVLPFEFIPAWP